MSILVTGGAGYIGSHISVELLNSNYDVIIIDNLCNSKIETIRRIKEITGKGLKFYHKDLLDQNSLDLLFQMNNIDAVIHLAGLKAVGESVQFPLMYYRKNIVSTMNLCEAMQTHNVKRLVFSSSATVYGAAARVPIQEDEIIQPTNPYGRTKAIIEQMLYDQYTSDKSWSIAILRYFNPIGAHASGLIGEDPKSIPNNLLPYISQVASGKLKKLNIYGRDYQTPDGTGIRDYLHVTDLAKGHLRALEKVMSSTGTDTYNLGTGNGYSVLDMILVFEKISGIPIPFQFVENRQGDVAISLASPEKSKIILGWAAEKGIEEMCRDAWHWELNNSSE
ncbi:UDP-glucose 4-epimerase GalE [Paenibacillus glacialis]|uniref:UDP-glucose 4-epimerase n=1 Tax=Paenibacillus glacialis TaxID=494026 RepID=A0A168PFC1_9BACL|nr:UDP-glucose 4-epimerase GalE [Paenibacillus glacialis]OAB46706.1 UDP-glucose 4-epimerase [Paenibacillus glacialis]